MRFFLTGLVLLIGAAQLNAQTEDSYEYQSEFTWGINKNTSGGLIGGFVFKKARKLSDRVLETYGLEVMNVKHPQEVRRNAAYTGNFFIYGKSNYLYAFRLQYGRDIILFKKAPQQGVEIKAIGAAGPSIGVIAPYYVQYSVGADQSSPIISKQFDPSIAADQIYGTGHLFEGIGQSKMTVGVNFKAALNFELGTLKSQVTGFEAGCLIDSYIKKVELMPSSKNYATYPTLFLTLFYGSRR